MLRGADKKLFVGQRLTDVVGGGGLRRYPNRKPSRRETPTLPITSNLIAWYDPSDLSTHTRTGHAVTALSDKSGSGFTLSVGSSIGEPMMSPMGTQDRLAIPQRGTTNWTSSAGLSDISMSMFLVACETYHGGVARVLISPTANGGFQFYVSSTGLLTTDSAGVANLGSCAGPTLGTPFVGASIVSATSCRQYVNLTGDTDTFGSTSFTAGRTYQAGAISWCGWIGEQLLYSDTKSNADAEAIIAYLMTKWGIS